MDLVATQTALKAWIAAQTGITPSLVVFANDARPNVPANLAIALLSWLGGRRVGIDETRWVDNEASAPDPNMVPTVVSDGVVGLQIAFESYDSSPAAPSGRAIASALRDRIWCPSSLAALRAANLGIAGIDDTVQADYRGAGQRLVNRAVLGVRFNATGAFTDATGAVGSLESVDVTSEIQDLDGTQLPAPLQMDHENIP